MNFQIVPLSLLPLSTGLVGLIIAAYAWRLRPKRGATLLALLALVASSWALGYGLEIAGADLATKLLWGKAQYIGIVTVPFCWLIFALEYAGRDRWLTGRNLVLLGVIPLITMLLAFTNESHGLIWSSYGLDPAGSGLPLAITHGAWFWVYWVFSQLVVLAGTIIVIRTLFGSQRPYRWQVGLILIAALLPWIGNILYVSHLNPVPSLDLTPFAFVLSAGAVALGLSRFRLISLTPIAQATVIEGMNDGMVVIDEQGDIVDLNPAAQQLIGLSSSQAIGRQAGEVFQVWPELVRHYQQAAETRHEISLGEGDYQRYYELRLSPLKSQRGEQQGRVLLLRDITDSKRAEEALAQQAARINTLYQLSQQIAATLDVEQVCAAAYHAVAQLLPVEAFFISVLDDTRTALQDIYVIDRGQRYPNERNPLTERGMSAHVIHSGEPLWIADDTDGTSQALGIIPFGTAETTLSVLVVPLKHSSAITGVMSAQHYTPHVYTNEHVQLLVTLANQVAIAIENARLVQSLRLQAAALDAAANAIAITDRAGIIQWVNPAFTTLTGYPAAEAVGQSMRLLKSGRHDAAFYRRLWDTILAGHSWQGEIVNRRKDGGTYIEQLTITPLLDETGEILRFIAIKQDITELITTRDQALEASRLKTELLARVSHELRTPLSAIFGYAELLLSDTYGTLTDPQRHTIQEMLDSALELTTLVNELLDVAQLEARTLTLVVRPFVLQQLVTKVATTMRVLAQKKGLELTTAVSPDLPDTLQGDEPRLQQVLMNLIGNAIKFTETGGVRVRLERCNADHWSITVSDTGPGIPEEARQYIYDPFRQVDGSITRNHRGAGLGLAIVKNLVDLMGGSIQLTSEVGQGSTFTVTLPLSLNLEFT